MEINLGPITLRHYSGDNWSNTELAFVTNRHGGMSRRETAVRVGFHSEHLVQAFGRDNPNDRYTTPEGNIVFGKISMTPDGGVHVLSAAQVYALGLKQAALKEFTEQAVEVTEPVTIAAPPAPEPEPQPVPAKRRRASAARR